MTDQPVFSQLGFSDQEWGLLVGLPHAVLTAASAAESDGAKRTSQENAAGLEAISTGRESGSWLVTEIAKELIVRVGDPDRGDELPALTPSDPEVYIADVLGRAREAHTLLNEKVDEGQAGAYKHWLVTIAEQVVTAAQSGGILGLGGDVVTEDERRFRDELSGIFND